MKKTIISILCAILAMSLLFCGCSSDDAVTGSDATYELSKDLLNDDLGQLQLFEKGCFYLSGTMTDETGETLPMDMAIKNGNSYMGSEMEGVGIAFMNIDGK